MKKRIYICHTFYHVYIACLKELELLAEQRGSAASKGTGQQKATLMLSTMSNDFGTLQERAQKCGLFEDAVLFEEKEDIFFPEVMKYHTDRGNIIWNMCNRIKYTKLLGKLQEPYVPVDLTTYQDIYVFCDSDPIGYYLAWKKIPYHAVEDGLNCICYYDTARYDNRGHFGLKAWMAAHNLIFMQNGWSKYCLDMEVDDLSILPYPCPKYIEKPRKELTSRLTQPEKQLLLHLFVADIEELTKQLETGSAHKVLILTEPLCSLEVRERLFRDLIEQYGKKEEDVQILIKPHPRDLLEYKKIFSEYIVLDGKFPMEMLNYIEGLRFDRVVSVYTVPAGIEFAGEIIFLGDDFMDLYEAPEIHRFNEQIS